MFEHALFPACHGQPLPKRHWTGPKRAVQRMFLLAYFRINLAYAKLVAWRKKNRPASSPRPRERRLLQTIEKAILARESLEDRFASRGVVATPVYRDGLTVDVLFSDPHSVRAQNQPGLSSASILIAFRMPAGWPIKPCKS